MKSAILFAALVFAIQTGLAQVEVMAIAEYMPSLEGCQTIKDRSQRGACTRDKITAHLNEYLKLPKEMLDAGIESAAVVELIIDDDGSVAEMNVIDDPGYGMGDAAMKALKKLNKSWYPAEHFGEKVVASMKVPVQFKLPEAPEGTESKETAFQPAPGEVFTVVEQMPAFAGCTGDNTKNCTFQALNKHCREQMEYPQEAADNGIEGMVQTRFVIDEEGKVTNVQVVEGIGYGCDEEAVRLIGSLPAWTPGKQGGVPVKVQMEIPVHFKLRSAD